MLLYINKIVFDCLVLSNSVYPDEILDNAAFHLGFHCFQKYAFTSHKESNKLLLSKDNHYYTEPITKQVIMIRKYRNHTPLNNLQHRVEEPQNNDCYKTSERSALSYPSR